jgi:hypothetical protein
MNKQIRLTPCPTEWSIRLTPCPTEWSIRLTPCPLSRARKLTGEGRALAERSDITKLFSVVNYPLTESDQSIYNPQPATCNLQQSN